MAFWKGAVIGSLAGAVYGIWTAPRSGQATRSNIEEIIEDSVARLTGTDIWKPVEDRNLPAEWYAPVAKPTDLVQESAS